MKRVTMAALAAGLALTPLYASPASAVEIGTKGRCGLTVNDRRTSVGRNCTGVAVSKNRNGGSTTVRFLFPEKPTIIFEGMAVLPSPETMIFTPSRVRYVEYRRGKKGKTITVTTFATRSNIAGRCDVKFNKIATEVRAMSCHLETEVGKIDVKFKGSEK